MTQLSRLYLQKVNKIESDAVDELNRIYHQIPPVPGWFERGVEWDGVLFLPEEGDRGSQLWLIEAKSALESAHITRMPDRERMKRTVEFLQLCCQLDFHEAARKHLLGAKPTPASMLKAHAT